MKGRHSFKFGFSTERDSKTEPGSQDYAGSYNFGHNGSNPLSTGNGYANALIGVFNNYNERDVRIDYDIRHWLTEGYAQDTWRLTPRFTLDYGVRLTHNGPLYEVRELQLRLQPGPLRPEPGAGRSSGRTARPAWPAIRAARRRTGPRSTR